MKKLLGKSLALTLISFSLMVPMAQAKKSLHDKFTGQGYGLAGCGLGSVIFGPKPGFVQVLAATTNGTSGNQTFGISSGTSNCEPGRTASASAVNFIEANKIALANDIARGQGETLSNLSSLYGCADSKNIGQVLKENYQVIFPSHQVRPVEIENSIKSVLSENKVCSQLS